MKPILGFLIAAAVAFGGPPMLCFKVESGDSGLFSKLEPLRMMALEADDSPRHEKAALDKLASLRTAASTKEADALIAAGFFTESLRQVGRVKQTDGIPMLLEALEQRSGDADLNLLVALAYAVSDSSAAQRYFSRAKELAKPGSPTQKSIESVKQFFPATQVAGGR